MELKEANYNSYIVNSKYKKHTGPGVKNYQKSTNVNNIHYRKWRKKHKRTNNKIKRSNNNKLALDKYHKIKKIKEEEKYKKDNGNPQYIHFVKEI